MSHDTPDEFIYARDLDGTGSAHICSKEDPGAYEYTRSDLITRTAPQVKLKDRAFDQFWKSQLDVRMEENFPDVIGYCGLVDCWKVDGWNDGTTTIYAVYKSDGGIFVQCEFADYNEPEKTKVEPVIEHTGWR